MNSTMLVALVVLAVFVILYVTRRRARLKREDLD
jgi:uncharacterized membrane protein YozB (DUF420 family)